MKQGIVPFEKGKGVVQISQPQRLLPVGGFFRGWGGFHIGNWGCAEQLLAF
jgi:hypothetical protein